MLREIIEFPISVMTLNKSPNEILNQLATNFPNCFPSVDELMEELSGRTDAIENWLRYSEDKRTTPGWYLVEKGRKYKIGYIGSSHRICEGEFNDGHFACALYIKLELEARILMAS